MAWHLYRLGRWSFRHRRIVLSFWIGLLLLMGIGSATLSGKTSDQFSLPGIESTKAFDLIQERTQTAADGATARLVFQAPKGTTLTDPANRAAIDQSLAEIDSSNVQTPADQRVLAQTSDDGTIGYASIQYSKTSIELTDADRTTLEDAAADAEKAGLTVAIGGDSLQEIPETGTT